MNDSVHLDLALARRIGGGDEDALRSLFDRFFSRLYRFVLSRLGGDHDAACDVVQQTFCKAIERLDAYRGEAALYTWFSQICRNTLIDNCRAHNRETRNVVRLEDDPHFRAVLETLAAPVATRPDVAAWQAEMRGLIQATVDALPDHYADVLEWKYAEGLPVRTIAGRLGIGEKAAESLLGRARDAFRGAIAEMAGTADAFEPPARN